MVFVRPPALKVLWGRWRWLNYSRHWPKSLDVKLSSPERMEKLVHWLPRQLMAVHSVQLTPPKCTSYKFSIPRGWDIADANPSIHVPCFFWSSPRRSWPPSIVVNTQRFVIDSLMKFWLADSQSFQLSTAVFCSVFIALTKLCVRRQIFQSEVKAWKNGQ